MGNGTDIDPFKDPTAILSSAVLARYVNPINGDRVLPDLFETQAEYVNPDGELPVRIWYNVGRGSPQGQVFRTAVVGTAREERLLKSLEEETLEVPSENIGLATEIIVVRKDVEVKGTEGYRYKYTFDFNPSRSFACTPQAAQRLKAFRERFQADNHYAEK